MNKKGVFMKDNFLVKNTIAHRGVFDNKKVPENSIKSFKNAINKGYIIEFDVHLTKDKKIVVFHDMELDRMTNKSGNIKDYTLKELQKIKLLDTDYTIPSLDEVLELIDGKVPILIEIKYDVKGFELPRLLLERLKTYNGQVAIQSFNPFLVSYVRFHGKEYLRGLLLGSFKSKIKNIFINNLVLLPFDLLICNPDFLAVDKKLYKNKKIKKYKKKKIVIAWTMKSKEDVDKYKDKFDNIICNVGDFE